MNTSHVLWWDFSHPGRLWALLIIPAFVIAYIIIIHFARNRGIRYTNTGVVGAVVPRQRQWHRHVCVGLTLCSLAIITGAWATPVGDTRVPRERATIVLVLDVSQSMMATDVSPSRFEAEKSSAVSFITSLPATYNVSIVTLSGHPNTLVPPTVDRGVLTQAVNSLTLQDGTAIADSITDGLSALQQAPAGDDGTQAPGLMVLLSDGSETSGGDPVAAAQKASEASVPIYTIAFGTQNGYVDLDGQRYNVAPDTNLLAQVASTSGGKALDASSAGELNDVYKDLSSDMGYETQKTEVTAQWVLISLMFGVVAAFGAVGMAVRWS